MIIEGIKSLLGDELSAQVEAALKGKGNALPRSKFKCFFNENPGSFPVHFSEAQVLTVLGNILIKAIFTR